MPLLPRSCARTSEPPKNDSKPEDGRPTKGAKRTGTALQPAGNALQPAGTAEASRGAAPLTTQPPLAIDEAELLAELLECAEPVAPPPSKTECAEPVAHLASKMRPTVPQATDSCKAQSDGAPSRKAAPHMLEVLLDPGASGDLHALMQTTARPERAGDAPAALAASPGQVVSDRDATVARFVDAVIEVARSFLDAETVEHAEALLAGTRLRRPVGATARAALARAQMLDQAETNEPCPAFESARAAWSALLRGDQADCSACGDMTLDEWAAHLLAGMAGRPADAPSIRRELRKRKVAAFGMLD